MLYFGCSIVRFKHIPGVSGARAAAGAVQGNAASPNPSTCGGPCGDGPG